MLNLLFSFDKLVNFYIILSVTSMVLWGNDAVETVFNRYRSYDQGHLKADGLPGISIEKFFDTNNLDKATELLAKVSREHNLPKEIHHWWQAKIAIKKRRYGDFKKHIGSIRDFALLNNTLAIKEIYELLPAAEKAWLAKQIISKNFLSSQEVSKCPFFELEKRKNRADFLYLMLHDHSWSKEIFNLLMTDLYRENPEVIDLDKLQQIQGFSDFFAGLSGEDLVKRMEGLLLFGKNLEARQTFMASQALAEKLSHEQRCELRYADAKIDRKLKKYNDAQEKFNAIAADCPAETKLKARYLDLMVKSLIADKNSFSAFDAFVSDYPAHSFTDDVLFFKANILLEKNDIETAQEVLTTLIERFPDGDMIHRALFVRSLNWAKLGQSRLAIDSLAELKKISAKNSLDWAAAHYWMARLSLFGDINNLDNLATSNLPKARQELKELINLSPGNLYSWLAWSLLEGLGDDVVPSNRSPKGAVLSSSWLGGQWQTIESLIKNGFRREALMLLEGMSLRDADPAEIAHMAFLYHLLNRPEAGHQKLVRCDARLAWSIADKTPQIYQEISYPRPFKEEVVFASQRVDLPRALIFSIMRQESGFLTEACSWARARGLMQMMYASAEEEAKRLGIKNIKEEHLYNPQLNILLASSLIKKYWESFGHLAIGLAAYNAGPGRAKAWLKKNQGAPLDAFIENIPFKETRTYVTNVLGGIYTYSLMNDEPLPRLDLGAFTLGHAP